MNTPDLDIKDIKDFSYKICETGSKKDYYICPYCDREFHMKGIYSHVARTHFKDPRYKKCGRSGKYDKYGKYGKQGYSANSIKLSPESGLLCSFGCNQKANYKLGSGNFCCEISATKCPEIRLKNSSGLKKAHTKGLMKEFSEADRIKSNINKINNAVLEAFKEYSGKSNQVLKEYMLYKLGWFYKCEICGISEWNNKSITLELDHINGNNIDNRISNLRLLCPNCHSQQPTSKNKGGNGKKKIPDEVIIAELKKGHSISHILKKFKMSGSGNYTRINILREKFGL